MTVASSVTTPRRRVEPEPDFLSPQVCQADLLASVVHGGKIGRPFTLFEHSVSPLELDPLDFLSGRVPDCATGQPLLPRCDKFYAPCVLEVQLGQGRLAPQPQPL